MKIPAQVFREYDIRGLVDKELTPEFAYLLGRAYSQLAKRSGKNNIAVGYDARLSSPEYARQIVRGLTEEGLNAIAIGMGPTPLSYFAVHTPLSSPDGSMVTCEGAIQVTGSHNPSDMNGFKICLGTHTLAGKEIQELRSLMESLPERASSSKNGQLREIPLLEQYRQYLVNNIKPYHGSRKLKLVCDAGNGVGGLVGPQALRDLGHTVVEMYCEPDGRFPNHHPDPTILENIQALAAKVKETGADFGIGWDGDADRIGVIDEKGQVIWGDMLTLLYGRALLAEVPHPTIIGDVKCSSILFDDLRKRGANPVMWKTGHSLIKSKLKELNGHLAGEMSGHICFKHRYFGYDDAIYATLRFVEIMSHHSGTVSSLLTDIPSTVATPEIRDDCPDQVKFKVAEAAQKAFPEFQVITIDGIRINFEHGWALVRASNTQPILVLRFEAQTGQQLEEYRTLVLQRLHDIKRSLGVA